MAKGNKYGPDCVIHEKNKKPPLPPQTSQSNTHDQCKEEYMDEHYNQFSAQKRSGSNNLAVATLPTSSVHDDCLSEYQSEMAKVRRKYMLLAKTSHVEEELFGREGWFKKKQANRVIRPVEKRPRMGENRDETPEETDVVIINSSDINTIKKKGVIVTPATIAAHLKKKEAILAQRNVKSNERKQLMLRMEAERKKKSGPMSDAELLKKQEDAITVEEARKALEEREDVVKQMNTIIAYSKCVTERDGQKMDRINKENSEKEYDMKWHHIMEKARHKLINFYDDIEEQKKAERYEGAKVIRSQIAYNELQRQIAAEQKLQEGLKLQRETKVLIEQDEKKAEAKRQEGVALLKYMIEENKKQEILQQAMKEREMIEEEKRRAYMFAKDEREQAYKDEQERIRKEKEAASDRIRAAQESASDTLDVLEDLRNQRIYEAHEKTWREKQKIEIEKLRRMNEELHVAREQQKIMKARQIADQAIAAEKEFYEILRLQKDGIEQAKAEDERLHQLRVKNLEYLKEQIRVKEAARKTEAREKILEGERIKQRRRVEELRLHKIKERKLEELQEWGVPPKYQVDLIKLKV